MKKLKLPESNDNYIDISQITNDFKGLIIAYKENKPIGYIQYWSQLDEWFLMTSINEEEINPNLNTDSILDMISFGLKNKIFDELKVIEFT